MKSIVIVSLLTAASSISYSQAVSNTTYASFLIDIETNDTTTIKALLGEYSKHNNFKFESDPLLRDGRNVVRIVLTRTDGYKLVGMNFLDPKVFEIAVYKPMVSDTNLTIFDGLEKKLIEAFPDHVHVRQIDVK